MFLVSFFESNVFNPNTTLEIAFFVIGGLGIFLFGLNQMSVSLKNIAGNRLKSFIEKTTNTPLKAIFTGILITVLIQSSSGTTVIVISLITAGLMTLPQAIGVIMGSNIGTTVTAFLVGLKIEQLALPIIGIGAILIFFFNKRKITLLGHVFIGFGMLFLGLQIMGAGFKVLTLKPWFLIIMSSLESSVFLSILTGTGLTALVQSSSAVIGILQGLYETGQVPIIVGLGILLGSNIGTTVTAVLSSIGGNRQSKQAALAHLFFNIIGSLLFIIFMRPFANLVHTIEINYLEPNSKMTIALAHIGFNVITTFILIFFIKQQVWLINKILPIKTVTTSLDKLNEELLESSPILSLKATKNSIIEMGAIVKEIVMVAQKYLNENNEAHYNRCLELEDLIDLYDHSIHDYLIQLKTDNLDFELGMTQAIYMDAIRDFERIGDHSINLIEFFRSRYDTNVNTVDSTLDNLNYFFERVIGQINLSLNAFENKDVGIAKIILEVEEEIDTLERKYRNKQLKLIGNGKLSLDDIHFVDILSNLERIADHCVNIAQNVIDPHYINRT